MHKLQSGDRRSRTRGKGTLLPLFYLQDPQHSSLPRLPNHFTLQRIPSTSGLISSGFIFTPGASV